MYKIIIFLISVVFSLTITAQKKSGIKQANGFYDNGNFNEALEVYLSLYEDNLQDPKLNYRIGVCYLNTNIDKALATSYLEKGLTFNEVNSNTYYLLGRAYHFAYRFNDAIKKYEEFKELNNGKTISQEEVDKQIEFCYNAIEIMKFPLDVTFQNLGSNINSTGPDYYPFVSKDESILLFNSKRDDGSSIQENGDYSSEIYYSTVKNGAFSKGLKLDQNINTLKGTEEIVGLSSTGNFMIFYFDNEESFGDLYIAEYSVEKGVFNVEKLPKEINTKNHEIAASISKYGNTIYFASDKDGGYGGVDIYVSRKLPNGDWSQAQNLGPTINTEYDEDFPNISPDNKTLYFSSKGHTSMGGYDIFKSNWDPSKRKWVNVKNIGFPINTPEDNMNYRESKSGRTGYISALREGGFGDLDIYSVIFNEIDPKYTILKGFVSPQDTSEIIKEVIISVLDVQTDEIYGIYMTNPKTGRYVIILPPGNFNFMVQCVGYKTYTEDVEIYGKSSHRCLIKKNFILNKE